MAKKKSKKATLETRMENSAYRRAVLRGLVAVDGESEKSVEIVTEYVQRVNRKKASARQKRVVAATGKVGELDTAQFKKVSAYIDKLMKKDKGKERGKELRACNKVSAMLFTRTFPGLEWHDVQGKSIRKRRHRLANNRDDS